MTLGNVQPGDIVLVNHNGRQAIAEVTSREPGVVRVRPLARGFTPARRELARGRRHLARDEGHARGGSAAACLSV
jgi:hypothetical protein